MVQEKDALAYLYALVAALTRPVEGIAPDVPDAVVEEAEAEEVVEVEGGSGAGGDVAGAAPGASVPGTVGEGVAPVLLGSDPEVRALGCLLEYAAHRARTAGEVPGEVLDVVAGVLAARAGEEAVVTSVGVHLPVLHRYAPAFAAAHRAACSRGIAGERLSRLCWPLSGADGGLRRWGSEWVGVPSSRGVAGG